jgi:hypothetical protein
MNKKPRESHDPTDMSHPLYDSAKDPMSPFYEGNDADSERSSDAPSDGAYKVGPGFPPKQYKWKKGCPSPFPQGRPRKPPSMRPDVKKAFEDAIFEKVEVKIGDKKALMTKINVGLRLLATQFAKGDRHARRDVFQYAVLLGVELGPKEIIAETLGIDEQAIVDAAFRRRQQLDTPAGSAENHVKAPSDLLDDDVDKPESSENPKATPQRKAEDPEPVLDENGQPIPVGDVRHVRAMRERDLARQKKTRGAHERTASPSLP